MRLFCDRALLAAVLCMGGTACSVSSAAAATGTGGAAMPEVIAPSTGGIGYGEPGIRSLVAGPTALLGRHMVVRGTMPGSSRRRVILQRLDDKHGWRNIARGRVRTSERFEIRWRADRSGRLSLRAVLVPRRRDGKRARGAAEAEAATAGPVVGVTVYRPAMASYYGPGFFGNQTACGMVLTPDMLGVAHRRLPCGTLVALTYKGRELTVPVIDRGPFSSRYSWDLTQATADALGFASSGAIGYTRVKPGAAAT